MISETKIEATLLENNIRNIILNCGIDCKLNYQGIDLTIGKDLRCEIKSCVKYEKNGKSTRNGSFRFKKKELNQEFGFYIFILKVNRRSDLKSISKYRIFATSKERISRFLFHSVNTEFKTFKISFLKVLKIREFSFSAFIEFLIENS